MHSDMGSQVVFVFEGHPTYIAMEWLLFGMCFHVRREVLFATERSVTYGTDERTFLRMYGEVRFQ